MINRDELVITVDEHNHELTPCSRRVVLANSNLWCRASNICIINNQKEILCQQRGKLLDISPNQWSVVFGGVANPGEEPIDTAIKELAEETGLSAKPKELHYFDNFKDVGKRRWRSLYVLVRDVRIDELKLEEEEVEQAKCIPIDELSKLIEAQDSAWSWRGYEAQLLNFTEQFV